MKWSSMFFGVVTCLTVICSMSAQAAPPIGPPDPVPPVKELPIDLLITNARDATGKNIGVRGQVDRVVADANAMAAQQPSVRVKIGVESFNEYGPIMSATTYTDRPNHRYVAISYLVGYKLYDVQWKMLGSWVGTTVTRHLSQSIIIQVFCDRWETGKGSLKLVTDIARPYMDPNQGKLEAVVDFFIAGQLTDFIDGLVRQQLAAIPIFDTAKRLPLECNALGRSHGVVADPKDDLILYSYTLPKPTPPTISNELSLTLQSIKRLPARDLQGNLLYAASETPTLEVFANQRTVSPVQLPALQEGQQAPVTANPIVLPLAGLTNLSVLVNIRQANGTQVDSTTRVYGQNVNYGNGTQTIRVPKSYWIPADPKTGAKPKQIFVDAYELTFRITAPGSLVADPGIGASPTPAITPGTVGPGVLQR